MQYIRNVTRDRIDVTHETSPSLGESPVLVLSLHPPHPSPNVDLLHALLMSYLPRPLGGCHLTINGHISRNKLPALATNTHIFFTCRKLNEKIDTTVERQSDTDLLI